MRTDLVFAVALLVLAAFVRWAEWMLPAEDPDVGVYLHVAYAWLHGHLPYLVAWEYKPPGLFALYAVALRICGVPGLAVQTLGTAATWATALALWRLGPLVDGSAGERSGRYAAVFAVLLSPENEGYLGDAEVLLAPFIAWALVIALERPRARTALWCGLLCGAALQMKLTALPLLLPVGFALARRTRRPLRALAVAGAAALFPFAVEAFVYARAGALDALWNANAGATWRRATGLHRGIVAENLGWLASQLRILAPALELVAATLWLRRRGRPGFVAAWLWLFAAVVAVLGAGEFYNRQFVLVQAPVALLGGIGLRIAADAVGSRARLVAVLVLIATFGLHDYWKTEQAVARVRHWDVLGQRHWREPEYDRILTMLRQANVRSSLYVIEVTPLLYDALGIAAPTRYADSDVLLETRMRGMIGASEPYELERIFAQRPRYVVVGGPLNESRFDRRMVAFVHAQLARHYRAVAHAGSTTLYQAKSIHPQATSSRSPRPERARFSAGSEQREGE